MTEEQQTTGAYIVIQKGPQTGKRIELWKDCTTLGRSRERDIFIEDVTVHRKQASILITAAGYVLRDDHGSGDCFVNGEAIKEQTLKNGDTLVFGTTHLIFYENEGTRPFQLPSSRGREMLIGKKQDPNASAIARLSITDKRQSARSIDLSSEMTIGRSRKCNIFLEDLAVSRLHATIRELPSGEYELTDHQSATGTFVNGKPIVTHILKEGDIVQIGVNQFTFGRSQQ